MVMKNSFKIFLVDFEIHTAT